MTWVSSSSVLFCSMWSVRAMVLSNWVVRGGQTELLVVVLQQVQHEGVGPDEMVQAVRGLRPLQEEVVARR